MPELPEVENVALALRENLVGKRLTGLDVKYAGILDQTPQKTRQKLLNKQLNTVYRHGKYLFLEFGTGSDASVLMIHLRMTGQVFLRPDYVPDKHVHLTFDFSGMQVHYRDIRKFGRLTLVNSLYDAPEISHIGPDMLKVTYKQWHQKIAVRKAPIKGLLLDQGIAAGLGNIYVDEALFMSGIHPLTRPIDLDEEQLRLLLKKSKQVLRQAIKHGGTTFMNFANFHGRPGNFQKKLLVYGRALQDCSTCGATIEKIKVAGRSSCYCPACQPFLEG